MPDHLATETASAPIGHPAAPMLDLQQFCGKEETRFYLMKPFSRGGFTWATNGHILVRVMLRPDIADVDQKFNVAKPLEGIEGRSFFRPSFELPAAPTEIGQCETCEGRGFSHACPDCECVCNRCHGSGELDTEKLMSASIGPTAFALNYVRQMLSLPGIEIEELPTEPSERPFLFRFQGGVGALMPMRGERVTHIDIKLRNDSKIT